MSNDDQLEFGFRSVEVAPAPARATGCGICQRREGHAPGCPNEVPPPKSAPKDFPETTEAIDRAQQHANERWLEVAFNVGVMLARRFPRFSSADIDIAMERDFPNVKTHEKRAMGAVMRRLAREGYIEKIDGPPVKDPRRRNHNSPMYLWRSLVYREVV